VNILSNIRQAWSAITGKSMTPFWQAWARGDDLDSGGAQLTNAYQQSVWVYTAVQRKAEQLAGVPFKLTRDAGDGETEIETGPLVELFRRPHPRHDRFAFWELVSVWLDLRGEAFLLALDRRGGVVSLNAAPGRGQIAQLLILNPDRFRHIVHDSMLAGWQYNGSPQDAHPSMYFLPTDLLHIRRPNPFDPWRGLSPLSAASLPAQTDYASAQFQKGLMLNNADTGVIITTDQVLANEQIEQIKGALRERKCKAGTADRPLFLHGGAKVEKPTINAADMQFLENRKFNRQEIFAVFGVPQELAGYTEDANRSVGESARLNFIENTMMPLGDRLEAALEIIVRAMDATADGWFDWEALPVMKAATRARYDSAIKLWSIGVPFNDLNRTLELGLDEYDWHKVGYLPFSVQRADEFGVGMQLPGELPEDPPSPDGSGAAREEDDEEGDAVRARLARMLAATEPHVCAPSGSRWLRSIRGPIKLMQGKVNRYLFEQRGRVLAKLEAMQPRVEEQRALVAEAKAWEELFDLKLELTALMGKLGPLQSRNMAFGAAQLAYEAGLTDFTLPPHRAQEFLLQRANKLNEVNETTFKAIQSQLNDALAKGETFDQMVARVQSVYSAAGQARAASIASTEVTGAINAGRQAGLEELGIEYKAWSTSKLPDVRSTHLRAEAEGPIPSTQRFSNGLMHPGDPSGPPGEVINCRCFMYAVLDPDDVKAAPASHLDFAAFVAAEQKAAASSQTP